MDLNFFVTLLLPIAFGSAKPIEYGDFVPKIHDIAFLVHLTITTENFKTKALDHFGCGGIIYNENIVVTAAQCLYYESDIVKKIQISAGTVNRSDTGPYVQKRQAKGFRIHDGYEVKKKKLFGSTQNHPDNIAMLWMDTPFIPDSYVVKTVKLPHTDFNTGLVGKLFGWGKGRNGMSSQHLRSIDLKTISKDLCESRYDFKSGRKTFCALAPFGNSVITSGDFGGPFVSDGKVIGLLSYGNGEKKPIIITNILRYMGWVNPNKPPVQKCKKPKQKHCALL